MRELPTDDASVRLDRECPQPAPREDAGVGVIHFLVADLRGFVAHVETVGVLHDELARAHQAEARADFVAEFHLDLIKVFRKLAVRVDLGRDEERDDFLVRGAEHPFTPGAVVGLEEGIAHRFVTAALLPDFGRLERGHEDFDGAGAVHFLADDLLDLAQRAQARRQEGIDAAREFADEAGAQEEFVREDFRFRRRLAEGGNEGVGPAHGAIGDL